MITGTGFSVVRPKQRWIYLHSKVNCKRLGSTYRSGQGRNHFLSVLVTILRILTSLSPVWQLLVTSPSIRTYKVYTSPVQNTQFLNDHAAARHIPSRTLRENDRQQPDFEGLGHTESTQTRIPPHTRPGSSDYVEYFHTPGTFPGVPQPDTG